MRGFRAEQCLGLRHILLARAQHLEIERLRVRIRARIRHVERGMRIVEILLARGAPARERGEIAQAFVLLARVLGVGLGRGEGRARLGDLLGPVAVVKPLDRRLLRRHLRLRLGGLGLEPARIEARDDRALGDAVALLHQHLVDALAVVEGEIDLTQIDVAVEEKLVRRLRPARIPVGASRRGGGDDDHGEEPPLHRAKG